MGRNFETLPDPDSVDGDAREGDAGHGDLESDHNQEWAILKREVPEDLMEGPADLTAYVSDKLGFSHPYLFVDVEYPVEHFRDLRDDLQDACTQVWRDEAIGEGAEVLPFPVPERYTKPPHNYTSKEFRLELLKAQERDPVSRTIIAHKRNELDPHRHSKRKTGQPSDPNPMGPIEMDQYRLAPNDGLLARRVILAVAALWIPFVPMGDMPMVVEPISWRRWLFVQAHEVPLNPHRTEGQTQQIMRRMGHWPSMTMDVESWCLSCSVCIQCRRATVR